MVSPDLSGDSRGRHDSCRSGTKRSQWGFFQVTVVSQEENTRGFPSDKLAHLHCRPPPPPAREPVEASRELRGPALMLHLLHSQSNNR